MKIGNVQLDNEVFLSPMAGVTDLPNYMQREGLWNALYRNDKC